MFFLKKRCDFTNFYTKKKSFEAQTPLIVLKTTVRYLHYSLKEGVAKWKTKNILFWVFFTDTIFFEIGRNMHDRISILHKMYFFAKKKCMYVLFSVNEFLTRAIEPCKKFPPKSYILLNFLVYVNISAEWNIQIFFISITTKEYFFKLCKWNPIIYTFLVVLFLSDRGIHYHAKVFTHAAKCTSMKLSKSQWVRQFKKFPAKML